MPQVNHERLAGQFARPEAFLGGLDASTAAQLVATSADVVLLLDEKGVICDMSLGNEALYGTGCEAWLGKRWQQTVTVESQAKVDDMLREAADGHAGAKWRHINHPSANGADLPLAYAVVPLAARAKAKGGRPVVALGRDLRAQAALQQRLVSAQVSMERDYWRLRHVETRYRLLFQMMSEAVLVLDADTERLEEANPAAHQLFGEAVQRANWSFIDSLQTGSRAQAQELLTKLRATGRADPVVIELQGHTGALSLAGSLFRHENVSQLLLRVTPMASQSGQADPHRDRLSQVMDMAPDAFVVTDFDGRVLSANRAFLDLAQLPNEELARGETLDKWLGRSGVDLSVLLSNLRQRGVVRLYATHVKSEYGANAEVEISAVAVPQGEPPCMGFTIRDVGRRLGSDVLLAKDLPRSADQMTELVGRVPLRDIVRETTDLIEQLCINAALQLTGDNRASAAEMLGLSRQSLYVKLRRFGMGDSGGTDGEA